MNKVNPIDPPALKEFLGEMPFSKCETLVTAEYDRFRIVDSRTRRLNGYSVSDEIAISIALSWLEGEIMGIEGYESHKIEHDEKGWSVYVDRKSGRLPVFWKSTKLIALIECHKDLVK